MKIIKVYEKFLDKIYEYLPEVKLASALVKLLNSIKPELQCKYIKNSDGIYITTSDKDNRLIYLDIYTNYINMTYDIDNFKNIDDSILKFLIYTFNVETVIYKSEIPKLIDDLTKENYENFLREKDIDKYNL